MENVRFNIETNESEEEKSKLIFKIFWFVYEFAEKKLEKREIKHRDVYWYTLHWIFNPEVIAFFVKTDFKAFLEGLFMICDLGFTKLLALNYGLDLLEGYSLVPNEIMD